MRSAEVVEWLLCNVIEPHAIQEEGFAREHPNRYRCWMAFRQYRIWQVAEFCAENFPGDLLEIGAYTGQTTGKLLEIAERHDRRVIAIDPWITGLQNCEDSTYLSFRRNIQPETQPRLTVIRKRSEHPVAIRAMHRADLCFAYVDGNHKFENVLSDGLAVSHCNGIIAFDDLDMGGPHVARGRPRAAFEILIGLLDRIPIYRHPFCEGYLVRRDDNEDED